MNQTVNRIISIAPVRKTIVVQTTPEKAFEVFTAGLDRWWPKSHSIGAAPLRVFAREVAAASEASR